MLKKLLVAVLALTMMIGLFNSALAAKSKLISPAQPAGQLETRARGDRTSPGCTDWVYESYWDNTYYIWQFPDVTNGTTFPNTRFTNGVDFELGLVEFYLRTPGWGSINGVGMTFYIWNSDADGLPNTSSVIYSVPYNPIVWAAWPHSGSGKTAYVDFTIPDMPAFKGNFNVGFSPIVNVAGQYMSIFSGSGDPATMAYWGVDGEGRSSSNYHGAFYSNLDLYGFDYSWAIDLYKCATPPPACDYPAVPNPTDQWPVWGHDFGRSSQSGIALGTDICGIASAWTYNLTPTTLITRTTPLIVNDKVYVVYADRVVCLELSTGTPLWSSITLPWGPAVSTLLSAPAIEDGWLYMGTGATVAGGPAGFLRVNAVTGALGWGRGAGLGTVLESGTASTQVSPPVIIGDVVFFGNQGGVLYALNKNTGVTLGYTNLTVTPSSTITAKMMGSLSSDGTNLFIGTANVTTLAPALGCVYSLRFNTVTNVFTQNWVYEQPAAVQLLYPGGFFSAPSYRCGNLFIQSAAVRNVDDGYCGYRQDLNPATGAQLWFADMTEGAAWNAPAATMASPAGPIAVFSNYNTSGYNGAPTTRGIRAVNTYNSTVWAINGTSTNWDNQVWNSATVTQDNWVFYGVTDRTTGFGVWKIVNGNTGDVVTQYATSGYVNGTAIAHSNVDGHDYIVTTTYRQLNSAGTAVVGSGLVLAFRDKGVRPRLVVPTTFVQFNSTNDAEALLGPVQRTATAAITNTGCADLTYTTTLSDGLVFAKIRTVSLSDQKLAANLAANLIDHKVGDILPNDEPKYSKFIEQSLVQNGEGDEYLPGTQVKPAIANSARLGIPTWAHWVSGDHGTIAAGGSADFTFVFTLPLMKKLGVNEFYVELSTNDPDYNPEIPFGSPQGVQSEIAYSMPYMYCGIDIDTMHFGTVGVAWANNIGLLGHGDYAREFTPSTAASDSDHMFQGSMFYAKDMNSAAWNPISGKGAWDALVDGTLLYGYYASGEDCGGCATNVTLPVEYTTDGITYTSLQGDICTYGMVDSGQSMGYYPNQDGPSMGILVHSQEIGVYGAPFADFKLTVQTINNRNATPINGLYYGSFVDWDVSLTNVDAGTGDAEKGYIYEYGSGKAYGQIGLPSKGSNWPDGTPTDPMYNGRIMHSRDDYQQDLQFDSLYNWIDKYAEGSITIKTPVDVSSYDKSYEVAFGKTDLGAYGHHTFGFATFGLSAYTSPTDVDNLRKFVNKLAGFGRGDIDNNNVIDLRDLVRLSRYVHGLGAGPVPFKHLGDVDNSGVVNAADVTYLAAYFFGLSTTPPKSTFVF